VKDLRANIGTDAPGRAALARLRDWPLQSLFAAVAAVLVIVWAINSTASLKYGIILGTVYGLAILGGNAIAGTLGSLNLSLGAFMALGAYTTAYAAKHGVAIVPAMLLGTVAAGAVGAVVAIPLVRLDGVFTALVTFALASAIPSLIVYAEPITGGSVGLSVAVGSSLLGNPVGGSSTGMLVMAAVMFVIVAMLNAWLLRHHAGRTAIAVGEEAPAAAVFGVRLGLVKVMVWSYGSAVAGLAGGLFALAVEYVSPSQFAATLSIFLFVGGLVGGLRSAWGALLGGLLVGTLPVQLQDLVPENSTGIVFGAVLFVTLLAGGHGIADWLERAIARAAGTVRRTRP
jgi:branched-chain amino acid transport system permease protein